MARGRMISKEISLDEKVNALSDDTAKLLFTWMIPHLDAEGRMYGEAQTFKSIVVPRRNISVKKIEKYLKEMEKLKLIFRYNVNGNQYIYKPNFEKHQTGLQKSREAQSRIPAFNSRATPELLQSKDGLTLIEDKVKVKDNTIYMRFENLWSVYPKKKSKWQAEKAFSKINPDDKLLEIMLSSLEKAKQSKEWKKNSGEFIPHLATWLNAKGWEDEYTEQPAKVPTWG